MDKAYNLCVLFLATECESTIIFTKKKLLKSEMCWTRLSLSVFLYLKFHDLGNLGIHWLLVIHGCTISNRGSFLYIWTPMFVLLSKGLGNLKMKIGM